MEKRVDSKLGFRIRQRITVPEDILFVLNESNFMDMKWKKSFNRNIDLKKICYYLQNYIDERVLENGLKDTKNFVPFVRVLVNPFDMKKAKTTNPNDALIAWEDATYGFLPQVIKRE
jgi:hypothetical protein